MRFYDGSRDKVCRLGLADLFLELQDIIFDAVVNIEETPEANSGAGVREILDAQFRLRDNWQNTATGGIDWIKRYRYNQTYLARIGVEVQVSARSDLVVRDIIHLRNDLQRGHIDVGVIIVPSDHFHTFLPDRTPALRDAVRYIEEEFKEAMTFPIIVIAVEYDGIGPRLTKRITNRGTGTKKKATEKRTKGRRAPHDEQAPPI